MTVTEKNNSVEKHVLTRIHFLSVPLLVCNVSRSNSNMDCCGRWRLWAVGKWWWLTVFTCFPFIKFTLYMITCLWWIWPINVDSQWIFHKSNISCLCPQFQTTLSFFWETTLVLLAIMFIYDGEIIHNIQYIYLFHFEFLWHFFSRLMI